MLGAAMKRLVVIALFAACGAPAAPKPVEPAPVPSTAKMEKTLVLVDAKGVGLGGHDPVSYTKGAPVAGSADHATSHGGATYYFATAEDKTAFEAAATKFAPA